MAQRKTVGNYTKLRHEALDTVSRAEIILMDLEHLLQDMSSTDTETMRIEVDYWDQVKQAQQLHRDLGRQLRAHEDAVRELKTFFKHSSGGN